MLILPCRILFAQPEMSKEQWEIEYDDNAVKTIKLLILQEELNRKIDSLKRLSIILDSIDMHCKTLYEIVGVTEDEVTSFRKKFDEAELNINSKSISPSDTRSIIAEISSNKITCLPEFSDRFVLLKKKIFETPEIRKETSSGYIVIKGDNLIKIAGKELGNENLWKEIYDLNKDKIKIKRNASLRVYLIYEGMELKLPTIK